MISSQYLKYNWRNVGVLFRTRSLGAYISVLSECRPVIYCRVVSMENKFTLVSQSRYNRYSVFFSNTILILYPQYLSKTQWNVHNKLYIQQGRKYITSTNTIMPIQDYIPRYILDPNAQSLASFTEHSPSEQLTV